MAETAPLRTDDSIHLLHNRTFDEIAIGDTAAVKRTLTPEDIQVLTLLSGYAGPEQPDSDEGSARHLRA
jgi:hypothetical protein